MLPPDDDLRRKGFEVIQEVMRARGSLSPEDDARMLRIARAFGIAEEAPSIANLTLVPSPEVELQAKAS
jgi:hypothetical protein